MSFEIEVQGGSSVRLPTAGKYCDRDIVVTASGGGGGGYTQEELDQAVADATEAGKQAEWNEFWDNLQNKGERFGYFRAFTESGWNANNFKPKYPINCYAKQSYHNNNADSIFQTSDIVSIDVPIIVTGLTMNSTFATCDMLETISLLELHDVLGFSSAFVTCSKLKNITVAGSIDKSIDFSATSVLTDASVQSILDHLKDLTGTTAQKLTLHATVGGKLTDTQKAAITSKNWTLVY